MRKCRSNSRFGPFHAIFSLKTEEPKLQTNQFGHDAPRKRSYLELLWEPQEFQAVRGKGVMASVNADQVLVGSQRLLAENGLEPAPLEGRTCLAGERGQDSHVGGRQ